MANNIWDNSDADNDGFVAANWSLGNVPTTGDTMQFTEAGVGVDDNCAFAGGAAIACDDIEVVSDYNGAIDLGTSDATFDPVAGTDGVVLNGGAGGSFLMGTGTMTINDGTFDNKDQTGFDAETSTLVMTGVGTIITDNAGDLNNVTIAAGATVTVDSATNFLDVGDLLNVAGDLILDSAIARTVSGDLTVQSGVEISAAGSGSVILSTPPNGSGISQMDGTISASVLVLGPVPGTVIAPSLLYTGGFKFANTGIIDQTMELSNGAYGCGSFEIETGGTGDFTLDNSVNGPTSITVTSLIVDADSSGDVIIDDTGGTQWVINGNVVDERSSTGDLVYTPGGFAYSGENFIDGVTWTTTEAALQVLAFPRNRVTATAITRDETTLHSLDRGAGNIVDPSRESFTTKVISASASGQLAVWAVANTLDDLTSGADADDLGAALYWSGDDTLVLKNFNGDATDSSITLNTDTNYFLDVDRAGGVLRAFIFDDEAKQGGDLVDALSVAMSAADALRYLFAIASFDDDDAGENSTVHVEGFTIESVSAEDFIAMSRRRTRWEKMTTRHRF